MVIFRIGSPEGAIYCNELNRIRPGVKPNDLNRCIAQFRIIGLTVQVNFTVVRIIRNTRKLAGEGLQ